MPFRFIAGSDDFLVHRKASLEWSALAEAVGDADAAEVVDGQAGNVEEVGKAVTRFVSAVQTISMFAPQKAVWFKGLNFLADSVTGRAAGTEAEIERIQHCLQHFDEINVHVLISATPVDRRKRAYKWFTSKGNSTFIEGGADPQAIMDLVVQEAEDLKVSFAHNAARMLAEKIGTNTRLALEETRKLATYLGKEGGRITSDMVAQLVPVAADSDFFEITEAFYDLNLQWTLESIQRHFFAGHDARPVIASLQNRNRVMIQLKSLMASGAIRGQVGKNSLASAAAERGHFFGNSQDKSSFNIFTQNPWYVGKMAAPLERLSLRDLLNFQEAFRDAFLGIIDRPNEQEAVIRAMAIGCLSSIQA